MTRRGDKIPTDQFQTVYLWHDPRLSAVKIGKTNCWKRFCPVRMWSALSANPTITFLGAWNSNLRPKKDGDAGEFAAQPFDRLRFATGAKEWFSTRPGKAVERMQALWGSPRLEVLPEEVKVRKLGPYDIFGSSPDKSGKSFSRLWLYRERQENGFFRLADSTWWKMARDPNKGSTTFAPRGLETLAGYEWKNGVEAPERWAELNQRLRNLKNYISDEMAPDFVVPAAKCGWVSGTYEEIEERLISAGLVQFDLDGPPRQGV